MTRTLPVVVFILACLLIPASASAVAPPKDRYIVVLKDSADSSTVASEHGRKYGVTDRLVYGSALEGYAGKVPPGQLDKIKSDSRVASVQPDGVAYASTTQSNPPWGLDRIDQRSGLSGTYSYTSDGTGVKAYVIDTGIRFSHTQFGGRAISGYDFVEGDSNASDCDGHGTHVAGTIGGSTYGVAKNVTLVSVRVLDCTGSGYWSWVIAGIDWVTANHPNSPTVAPAVANMSLGGGAYSAVDNAVNTSINDGVTYSIAAGNSNRDACGYTPARVANALTIGSTTSTDARSSFSNYGSCVDWFAPGSSILSAGHTTDTATATMSGTSMAAPHNAGAAALYLQGNPAAAPATVRGGLFGALTTGVVTSSNTTNNHLLYVGPAGSVTPPPTGFTLTTRGFKVRGTRQAELSWTGSSATSFIVKRDGQTIATTSNNPYVDAIGGKGGGSFTYQVCEASSPSTCSNTSTVTF